MERVKPGYDKYLQKPHYGMLVCFFPQWPELSQPQADNPPKVALQYTSIFIYVSVTVDSSPGDFNVIH